MTDYIFREAIYTRDSFEEVLEELADMNNLGIMFLIRAYQEGVLEKEGDD